MKDYRNRLKINSNQVKAALKLVVFPLFLYLLFIFVYNIHLSLKREATRFDVSHLSDSSSIAPYPVLDKTVVPQISAQSAVIMDDASKVMVYEKNPQLRFSMASTTKLMTALVALDHFSLNDTLLIYRDGAEGSVVGLQKGEQYTLEALLYAMLLPSANDAAIAIADNYPGGKDAFVKRMNEKAEELMLEDTVYSDPSGLNDSGNYTTARDLARLASYATENEIIESITGTKTMIISDISKNHTIPLRNLNELLGTNGVVGIKTGFTEGARGVLTTARESEGHRQIIVVMRSADRFGDTAALLSLLQSSLSYRNPSYNPLSLR